MVKRDNETTTGGQEKKFEVKFAILNNGDTVLGIDIDSKNSLYIDAHSKLKVSKKIAESDAVLNMVNKGRATILKEEKRHG